MAECLLKKIQAIAVVNEEIIERIQGTSGSVSGFKYRIREACFDKGPMFFVEEVKQERSAKDMVTDWKGTKALTVIDDIFNDNLNFTCCSFEDLMRLNAGLLKVGNKYALFGESTKAQHELEKFKANLEIIQTCLGEIEESLTSKPSQLQVYQGKVAKINLQLSELGEDSQVAFNMLELSWKPNNKVEIVGGKVRALSNTCYAVHATRSIPQGSYASWKIKIVVPGSHISIGVTLENYGGSGYLGNGQDGWCLNETGQSQHSGVSHGAQNALVKDEIIEVTVNRTTNTISWKSSVKGALTSLNTLPPTGVLVPAVMVYQQTSVELVY